MNRDCRCDVRIVAKRPGEFVGIQIQIVFPYINEQRVRIEVPDDLG